MKNGLFDDLTASIENDLILKLINEWSQSLIFQHKKYIKDAAELGWTFGLTIPFPVFKKIVESNESEEINSTFLHYYLSDGMLNKVIQDIRKRTENLPKYLVTLIDECIYTFENEKYQLTIVGLFSAIEGIMSLFYSDDETLTRYNSEISQYLENDAIGVLSLPLLSLKYFLENTFSAVPFNIQGSGDFCMSNRHWALHGRYKKELTQEDAIKLLLGLATTLFVNDGLRKPIKIK